MILITCVDNNMGMLFNHRRQSQDRVLKERILKSASGKIFWMNHYSENQFKEFENYINNSQNYNIDEHFLSKAACNDICFVEDCSVAPFEQKIEKIILYKWNRDYPDDFYFDIPLSEHGWKLISSEDFVGSSHDKITEEIYVK